MSWKKWCEMILLSYSLQLAITDIQRYVHLQVGAWVLSVQVSMYDRSSNHASFTFSSRQHETRWEQEYEGYIHLVFHTLNLF